MNTDVETEKIYVSVYWINAIEFLCFILPCLILLSLSFLSNTLVRSLDGRLISYVHDHQLVIMNTLVIWFHIHRELLQKVLFNFILLVLGFTPVIQYIYLCRHYWNSKEWRCFLFPQHIKNSVIIIYFTAARARRQRLYFFFKFQKKYDFFFSFLSFPFLSHSPNKKQRWSKLAWWHIRRDRIEKAKNGKKDRRAREWERKR